MIVTLFWCAYTARGTPEYLLITRSWFAAELSMSGQDGGCKQRGQPAMISLKNALFMPRLAICSRDLHWHWINGTLFCNTMEVSMLSRAWLTIAQHVFQPTLTGRPELIPRKIVSSEPGTKVIAVSRFCEKLSPANWVQGVTAISRKISRSWAPKKWGPTCDRDISNSAIYTTAIYRAYTVLTGPCLPWEKISSTFANSAKIVIYFGCQLAILHEFHCMKFAVFWSKFHWRLFPGVIFHYQILCLCLQLC